MTPVASRRFALYDLGALPWAESFCRKRGVALDDVLARRRFARVSPVRQDMWRLVRDTLDLNYCELGRIFGRDRTTIMHGVERSAERAGLAI